MKIGELPIASIVREKKSKIEFFVADRNHPGYGGTTLITRYVIGARAFDAAEPESPQNKGLVNHSQYGNNDYATSNIHQWLNASEKSGWYAPAHQYDAPPSRANVWYGEQPYDEKPGFLYRFSERFRDALLTVDIPYVVRKGPGQGELSYVQGKVFLMSRAEINYGGELNVEEGSAFQIFIDDPYYVYTGISTDQKNFHGRSWNPPSEYATWDDPGIYDPIDGWKYWLRSCGSRQTYLARVFSPTFRLSYDKACCDITGVRPAMNVDSDIEIEETIISDGKTIYLI